MEPESSLLHSQVPTTSPYKMYSTVICPYVEGNICTLYGTATLFSLLSSCTVCLYKGEGVLTVMGRILKAVSHRYMVQLYGPNYVCIALLTSVRE